MTEQYKSYTKDFSQFREEAEELLAKTMYDIPHIADVRSKYTVEQKLISAMGWVLTGSCLGASQISGTPASTIRKWKEQAPWWNRAVAECKKVAYEALDYKFGLIINEIVSKLETRLRDGDKLLTKDGLKTQPVRARDLANILATIFDKRQLVRGDVTSRSEKVDSSERLRKLQEAAESFGRDIRGELKEVAK